MNICRFFIIAVFCLFTGIVNGMQQAETVFDLPPIEIYGLGEQIMSEEKTDTEEKIKMLFCSFFGNGTNYIIKFPSNGRQPTTEEAVEWACANADLDVSDEDRLNSPITQWYMKMFGVVDMNGAVSENENDYIKAGYDGNNNNKRIISYDASMNEYKETFIDNFKKIASTSVGRVLLYRILIEIRRKDGNGNGVEQSKSAPGYLLIDKDVLLPLNIILDDTANMKERNSCRALVVKYDKCFSISAAKYDLNLLITSNQIFQNKCATLSVNFDNISSILAEANMIEGPKDMCVFFKQQISMFDVNIFHEFIHWFHKLSFFRRSKRENYMFSDGIALENHPLGQWYYLGSLKENDRPDIGTVETTALLWKNAK